MESYFRQVALNLALGLFRKAGTSDLPRDLIWRKLGIPVVFI